MTLIKKLAFLFLLSFTLNMNAQETPTEKIATPTTAPSEMTPPATDNTATINKELSEKEIKNLALFESVNDGDADEVKKLVKAGQVDYYRHNEDGETLLTLAIKNNDVAMTKILVQDAIINLKNSEGETPLTLAIKNKNPSIIRLVLKRAKSSYKNSAGEAPLFLAIENKDLHLLQRIIKKGGDVNRLTNGVTPLAQATQENDYKIVSYLIKNGAQVNQPNEDGEIPLYIAITKGNDVIAGILINKSAEPFEDVNWRNRIGDPIITEAAKMGNPQIIKMLLNAGANVDDLDYEENTPLHIAAAYGNAKAVSVLLQFNAKIDQTNIRGCTPLIMAAQSHQTETYEFLKRNGATTDVLDYLGYTADDYFTMKDTASFIQSENVVEK